MNKYNAGRFAFPAALLSSTLLSGTPVFAQASEAAASDDTQSGLSDIIVTARKRSESSQDVPVAIAAFSAETIQKQDLTSLEKISSMTPSFSIGRAASGSGAQLTLRGVGSSASSIGIEQSVAVVVDSVYYGNGRFINEGLFDLARLEILKGPQSLFYGKNATAGVISVVTADPTDKTEIMARLGYEFRARQPSAEFVASGPITDTLGVRLALRGSKMFGSLFKNLATPQVYRVTDVATGQVADLAAPAADRDAGQLREYFGRLTVKWAPTDRLTATVKVSGGVSKVNNPGYNFALVYCPGGTARFNPAIQCGRNFNIHMAQWPAELGKLQKFGKDDGSVYNTYKSFAATGTINYELDKATVTSVTNYNWARNTWATNGAYQSSPRPQNATESSSFWAFSNETRVLTTFDGPFNALLGAYYQKSKRDYDSTNAAGGVWNSAAPKPEWTYTNNVKDSGTKGETMSGFGQIIWKALENLEFNAGVRYVHETKDSYFLHPYAHPTFVANRIFLPGVTVTADQTFEKWSPEATVSFKPTEDVNVYAGFKSAYKSGGFSNSGILSPTATVADFAFGPESAKGFEGGVKTTLLDRQLRFNVAAYTYKYKNLQVDYFDGTKFAFTTYNAGSLKVKGIEAEFEFAPHAIDGFQLRGSLNYNRAKYGSIAGAPCYSGQTPAAGCTIDAVTRRTTQDLSGTDTANAPRWTASLGANYDFPISDDLVFGVTADARYNSSYLASYFGDPFSRQKRFALFNASLRVSTADEKLELALIGKNLTNKFYINGVFEAPNTGSGTGTANGRHADLAGFANSPRTVQAQLTWRY